MAGLAYRVAGVMWLTAPVSLPLYLTLPFPGDVPISLVLAASLVGLVVGLWCLRRASDPPDAAVHQVLLLVGIALVAGCMWQLGGADSPSRYYLVPQVVYAAVFLRSWVFPLAVIAAHALPLAYDQRAVDSGFAVELAIAAPMYLVVWWTVAKGTDMLLQLRDEAEHASVTDSLTGLPNRRGFGLGVRVGDDYRPGALLFVDIDHFKWVNDEHGHETGDRILQHVADAIRGTLRTTDLAARHGGEEFLVWLPHTDPAGAEAFGERLRARAHRLIQEREGLDVTVSVGLATGPVAHLEEVLRRADTAMYAAKLAGRDRLVAAV